MKKLLFITLLVLFFSDYSLSGVLRFNNQTDKLVHAIITETSNATPAVVLIPQKITQIYMDQPISSITWFSRRDYKRWKADITRTFTKADSDIAELIIYPDGEYIWKSSVNAPSPQSPAKALNET